MRSYFASLLIILFSATIASAVTLDFEGSFSVASPGGSIDFGEYRFTAATTAGGTGAFLANGDVFNGTADTNGSLFNANGAEFTLTRIDGGAFDLLAFDFSRRPFDSTGSRSARSIDLVGSLLSGGSVSMNTGPLSDNFTAASIPSSFTGLESVIFRPLQSLVSPMAFDYEFLVDNLEVQATAVPIPASLPLLLAGLSGVGLLVRRRRKST